MQKIIVVLLTALVLEAIGVVFLKKGISQIGEMERVAVGEILRLVKSGATNPNILVGLLFETLFFFGLLYLMSKSDISFVWPMTALGFVITPIAAHYILQEQVGIYRWMGIALIVTGAGIITWSEHQKTQSTPPPPITEPAHTDTPSR